MMIRYRKEIGPAGSLATQCFACLRERETSGAVDEQNWRVAKPKGPVQGEVQYAMSMEQMELL